MSVLRNTILQEILGALPPGVTIMKALMLFTILEMRKTATAEDFISDLNIILDDGEPK